MNETPKFTMPKNLASVIAAICFAWIGHVTINAYATAHWSMTRSLATLEIKIRVIDYALTELVPAEKQKKEFGEGIQEAKKEIRDSLKALREARSSIMTSTAIYHLCGLLAFIFTIYAFISGPGWFTLIAVPFGCYGLFCLLALM